MPDTSDKVSPENDGKFPATDFFLHFFGGFLSRTVVRDGVVLLRVRPQVPPDGVRRRAAVDRQAAGRR